MTDIWEEPARGDFLDPEAWGKSASERVQRSVFDKERPVAPIARLLGASITQFGPGSMTCTMPVTGWLQHFNGTIDPSYLVDLVMRWVVESVMPPMSQSETVQLHVNHIRTVLLDAVTLIAKGRVVHVGRSYAVAQVELEDARGRLMTHAVGRYAIRPMSADRAAPNLPGGAGLDPYLRPPAGRLIPMQRLAEMVGPGNAGAWAPAVNDSPMAHLLGFRVVEVEQGSTTVTMPVTPWLLAIDNTILRGMLVTPAAVAMYGALGTISAGQIYFRPADLRADFFRDVAADGRLITARSSIAAQTEDSDLAQAEVYDADGNLVAFVTERTVRTQDPLRRRVEDHEPDRILATILFTDIVGSTEKASELGDDYWNDVLARHHELVRAQLDRHGGREVKVVGDGFMATFDSPAGAIRCAKAIAVEVPRLGIEIRAGIHTGECEVSNGDLGGITVHIGARIAAEAGARELLVSGTVRDMLAGSSFRFADRGTRQLKGVEGDWRIYSVEQPPNWLKSRVDQVRAVVSVNWK